MNLQEAPVKNSEKGYLFIEVVLVTTIILGVVALSFKGLNSYKSYLARTQLKLVANIVAMDVMYVQQKSLFDGDYSFYVLETANQGYTIKSNRENIKTVNFSAMGYDDIYFNQYSLRLSFNNNGRPNGNNYLTIRHKKMKEIYYRIDIEPVTGRVVIHEKS